MEKDVLKMKMKIKRLRLITLCIVSLISVNVMAFDFGSIIAGAVKDAVTEVATDVAKDSTKAAAKSVAKSQGIEGADQYIDAAVENAENIQNVQGSVANASASAGALKGLAGSGPLGAASAVLSSAGIAQDTVKLGSAVGRPDPEYSQEYMAISSSMGSCKDNPCILKHQQQLINLQKRAEAYQVNTGDANLDGQVDGYDVRQAKINAAMAKIHSCSSADQKCKNQGYEQLRAVDNLASAQNGEATNAHPAATLATEAMGKLMGSFGFGK
jgi:hypothetical protein